MIRKKHQLLILSSLLLFSFSSFAKTMKHPTFSDNSNIPPQNFPAPMVEELGLFNDQQIEKLSANFVAEAKRRPAGATLVGTEDMLSKEYIQFRNELLKVSSGIEFYALIKKYDDGYSNIPATANDLKFTIARMATWLPMKGIIWRMTPMVHQVATTQEVLLSTLKNYSEQVKINMPGSHVEAQMLFLTMPTPDLLGKEFHFESDFVGFLAKDVYESLKKSADRLQAISMYNSPAKGEATPILFDGKIRFGDNAFSENYDDYERFKVVGEAERFATLARTHRRMYSIAVMAGYNWNGHLALKREIGKLYGMGIAESALFDALPGAEGVYLRGVSRDTRVATIKRHTNLYTLTSHGQSWMNLAYFHLHMSGLYLGKTWDNIKNNTGHYAAQLDPEMFMARKEQVEVGMMNIKKLVGAYGAGVNGTAKINGTLSGDEIVIDIKAFYENAPADLKKLLPIAFSKNEDLNKLKNVPMYKSISEVKAGSDVLVVRFPDSSKPVHFRNYLYGRSTAWSTAPEAYGRLFPNIKKPQDIADAMRILNETRGSRLLAGGLTLFVR
ncbi:MAG: hypothetical protein PHY93_10340 [Bacteriovorax sp.]|nr:hypothetical protein [Bacteriovorax sp.]